MTGLRSQPFRVAGRFIWLATAILVSLLDFLFSGAGRSRNSRAFWLQRNSRRILNIFKLKPEFTGTVPTRGLLISNHLTYLDILVLSSITPAIFVSKREVKFWPVFGLCAQMGGTLFVDSERRTQVGEVNSEIKKALDDGALVILFPEGTSSNGETILPFKSALLQPAVGHSHPISVACIQYALDDGDAGEEVCYWGDDTFFPHMMNLLGKRGVKANVQFAPFLPETADRKEFARRLRDAILQLKNNHSH